MLTHRIYGVMKKGNNCPYINDKLVIQVLDRLHQLIGIFCSRHVVNVSNDLLLKLFTHSIELRIWDTMGKVGVKARFTKLKQFKIPNSKPGKEY